MHDEGGRCGGKKLEGKGWNGRKRKRISQTFLQKVRRTAKVSAGFQEERALRPENWYGVLSKLLPRSQ